MRTRRGVIAAVGAVAFLLPFAAPAQEMEKEWRIGFLVSRHRAESLAADGQWGETLRVLHDLGYVDGKNVALEWRFADGRYDRLSALAAELVELKVSVIVTDRTPATLAAQRATATIPIVFTNVADPVENGVVKSLSKPGGHTTGVANLLGETCVKQMEMLRLVVPGLFRLAVVFNPGNQSSLPAVRSLQAAAQGREVTLSPFEVRAAEEVDHAFLEMISRRADAFIWVTDPLFFELKDRVAELALRHRVPSAAMGPAYPSAGGLMSYGQNVPDNYRRAATYVDKILKGANPGDIPVEQPRKLELVINRKTAKALGLTIPPELLVLADRVIE
jgi:putative ABC transport system substrate-binding protein